MNKTKMIKDAVTDILGKGAIVYFDPEYDNAPKEEKALAHNTYVIEHPAKDLLFSVNDREDAASLTREAEGRAFYALMNQNDETEVASLIEQLHLNMKTPGRDSFTPKNVTITSEDASHGKRGTLCVQIEGLTAPLSLPLDEIAARGMKESYKCIKHFVQTNR